MDESQFKALRTLANDGTLSQRDLSRKMGISLGRTNYVIRALLDKGLIKAKRFKNSRNKIAYSYILTPTGFTEKVRQTRNFLDRKRQEYEQIRREIEELTHETELQG